MAAFLDFWREFGLVFLPLFVVMDPVGILAFLVPFLDSVETSHRGKVIATALVTGLAVGLLFLGVGRGIFIALNIGEPDFLIAGGLVLLVVALRELLSPGAQAPVAPNELMAVVPIGTPLLVGPATISMLILLSDLHSVGLVVLAFLANVVVAWAIFTQAQRIFRFLGRGGLLALSRVTYLLLAAVAVQLVRQGITQILEGM